MSAELFVLAKALLGFGLPLLFGAQQLWSLRRSGQPSRRGVVAGRRR